MSKEKNIIEFCRSVGCDLIGFASAEQFLDEKKMLQKREEKNNQSPYEEENLLLRIDPSLQLTDVKTIISLGFNYDTGFKPDKPIDTPRGRLSRFALVKDYHIVISSKLKKICQLIADKIPGVKYKYFVDTGPLLERAIAYRAGLGFFGHNNCFTNLNKGSYFFLGEILLNIKLFPSSRDKQEKCLECNRCLAACPSGALIAPYSLDYKVCLSYISQSKDIIPVNSRSLLADQLYGCDICQEVCPFNSKEALPVNKEFLFSACQPYPELLPLLQMSSKNFKKEFQDTSFFWRGRTTLQRNAIIILGNLKSEEGIPYLKRAMQDPRPEIRAYAAWSLAETAGDKSHHTLLKSLKKENNDFVRSEITQLLKN